MIIAETQYLQALLHQGRSRYVLVAFAYHGWRANGVDFWAKRFAAKTEITTIGILHRNSDSWFPSADMQEIAARVRAETDGYDARIGYGASMGAYAALKYMRLLGLNICLAFSPQASIDPDDVASFDTRFTRSFDPVANRNCLIQPGDKNGSAYMFYDPFHRSDHGHARLIQAAYGSDVVVIPAYGTSHYTILAHAGQDTMTSIIDAALAADVPRLRQISKAAQRASAVRAWGLAEDIFPRHPALAMRVYGKYEAQFALNERADFRNYIAGVHRQRGELRAAYDALAEAHGLMPDRAQYTRKLADLAYEMGDATRAAAWLTHARDHSPADAALDAFMAKVNAEPMALV